VTAIAVAGASGFIGGAIVRALEGRNILALGREVPAGTRADVLVWAAGRREADLAANCAVHVEAPVRTARAIGATRVVYLSSGECYGPAPLPYREDGPALGTSDYARAKLAGERALGDVAATTVLRLGVVYGPGQSPRMLIPEVAAGLKAGKRVALSPGEQTRDFVFVEDVARAVVRAIDKALPTTTVNIASGREVRVRDAVTQLCRALGASEELLGFGDIAMRPNEVMQYVLDVQRAADVLGWRATTTLADGFARLR
jgi:nucleoside-diphosphate-sugar epimerase